jgi:hypothetical protein
MKTINSRIYLAFVVVVLAFLWLLPQLKAVVPPPDGAYLNFTTAEGQNALHDLTTGAANTALGAFSLFSTASASFNTAVGAGALDLNTGDQNTAVGVAALLINTGINNTAVGTAALELNEAGSKNTANGAFALFNNAGADDNTATGYEALFSNATGAGNTAVGFLALSGNTGGSVNTAIGDQALLANTTGVGNVAMGFGAGAQQTTGSDNVYIGTGMQGVAGESDACYIANIFGQTSANGIAVLVNSSGKLGTTTSSRRFKQDVKPMNESSEALFELTPVTFRYKKEIDPQGKSQFGLVAEDVEKVNPDLVVRDKEGKPYSVRYDQVNAMLLNEFLKEHRHTEKLEATVAQQQKQIEALTVGLQKVSAQLKLSKPEPQMVNLK